MNAQEAPLTLHGVSKMSKADLRALIYADARERGRQWVLGGPDEWSHDELVRYIVHDTALLPASEIPTALRDRVNR